MAQPANEAGGEHYRHHERHDEQVHGEREDRHDHDVAEPLDEIGRLGKHDDRTEQRDAGLVDEELDDLHCRGVAHLETHLREAHDLRRGAAHLARGEIAEHDARRRHARHVARAEPRAGEHARHAVAQRVEDEVTEEASRTGKRPARICLRDGVEERSRGARGEEPDDEAHRDEHDEGDAEMEHALVLCGRSGRRGNPVRRVASFDLGVAIPMVGHRFLPSRCNPADRIP